MPGEAMKQIAKLKDFASVLQEELDDRPLLAFDTECEKLFERAATRSIADTTLDLMTFLDAGQHTSDILEAILPTLSPSVLAELQTHSKNHPMLAQYLSAVDDENRTVYKIGDAGYERARLQYATSSNPSAQMTPKSIAVVHNFQGIIDTLNDLDNANAKFAIRTGGHQYSGNSSTTKENVQIDLSSGFTRYEYRADENILHSGVSFSLKRWLALNSINGIFLPTGVCESVYLGGHVHTGGIGNHSRGHAFLSDHVMGFKTIVTSPTVRKLLVVRPSFRKANPRIVERWMAEAAVDDFVYDETLNDDLFFATLGGSGGGDMSIAVEFFFRPQLDKDYPNSTGWIYAWKYSKGCMQDLMDKLVEVADRANQNKLPGDFDVMLTIVKKSDKQGACHRYMDEMERAEMDIPDLLVLTMASSYGRADSIAVGKELIDTGNKRGELMKHMSGGPYHKPLSKLIQDWVMHKKREYKHPFVRGSRATTKLLQPEAWARSMTDFTDEIMQESVDKNGLLVTAQFQLLGGTNTPLHQADPFHETALPLRDTSVGVTFPIFYTNETARGVAEDMIEEMGDAWIGSDGLFSDVDFRVFAFTWGNRNMDEIWKAYYRDDDLYRRIRGIKARVDPDMRLNSGPFAVTPLER